MLAVWIEQVLDEPLGVLVGVHEIAAAVGARFVKVIVTLLDVPDVPPCPSDAVAVAAAVPGVARLYVVLLPVAAPVLLALDHV